MHILVVTSDRYPPFRPASEAVFGSEFTRRGHRVDWLMPADGHHRSMRVIRFGKGVVFAAPREEGGSRIRRSLNYLRDFANDLRVFSLARRYKYDVIQVKDKYDVIQVKDKYVAGVLCLLAARINGVPFSFWLAYPHAEANLHGARQGIVRYRLFYWFRGLYQSLLLYRVLLPAADHVFVQSEQMRSDMAAKGISREKMTPIPGSLNLSKVPFKGNTDPGPSGKRILYIGTLIRERKLDFLVRVFAKITLRHDDATLIFVGSGENSEDEALLRREIKKCGVDEYRVTFAGRVPREKVWRFIEESMVCLSPYYPSFALNSTSPTKLLEYMAMSRPVVANEHPEQSLVLAESGAGICVPWSEQAFAEAIEELLDDPELCRRMGANGHRWVKKNRSSRFLADVVEKRYKHLIRLHGDSRNDSE